MSGSYRRNRVRPIGALDGAGDFDPRPDVELAEDVSHVRLDGLRTEKEALGDLGVRSAIDDEPRDLTFAFRQRIDTDRIHLAGMRAPMDVAAQPPEIVIGRVTV